MGSLTSLATGLVDQLGAAGVAVGGILNGLGLPGIAEVLLPVVGVSVRQGHQQLGPVLVAAFVGQFIGLVGAYAIGRYGGLTLIERYGRYVLITRHEIDRAQHAFERFGGPLIVVGAFIPGIQGFIGYIGGLATMSFRRFLLYVMIGKAVWIGGLIWLGYVLGNHVEAIDKLMSKVGLAVFAVLLVGIIWYIIHQTRRPKA